MSSTAPEWLAFVEESAYGVPVASPVVGTSLFFVPLIESNSFAMVEDPVLQEIKYGGGFDVVADVVSDHHEVKGSLSTIGTPLLTAFLMNAAVTRVNAGQTLPWVTGEQPMDLASFTAYHVIRRRDGTLVTRGYSGCKVASIEGSVSRQDPKLKLKLELVAQKETPNSKDSSAAPTAPTAPTDAQYERGPYLFSHTSTNLTYGSAALAQYESLTFKVQNLLDPRWWENPWLFSLGAKGRTGTADVDLLLKATPALRSDYLALTPRIFKIKFDNGTHSQTIDYQANNYVAKLPDDLPLGKEFLQKLSVKSRWDATAGADVTVTSA